MQNRVMKQLSGIVVLCCLLAGCGPNQAASDAPELQAGAKLTVESLAFKDGETIPEAYSGYGQAKPIALTWNTPPSGTKSLAILVEDPDAPGSSPFVHWLVTNIPASARKSGEGDEQPNSAGDKGYFPPKPPPGSAHHYHFEVFALDLPALSAKDRDALLKEIKGHIVAKGEIVGLYKKP